MANEVTPDQRMRRKLEAELRAANKACRAAHRQVELAHAKLTAAVSRVMDAQDALDKSSRK